MTELNVSVEFWLDYGYCYSYGVTMTDVIVVAMLRTLLVDGGYDAEWCLGLFVQGKLPDNGKAIPFA